MSTSHIYNIRKNTKEWNCNISCKCSRQLLPGWISNTRTLSVYVHKSRQFVKSNKKILKSGTTRKSKQIRYVTDKSASPWISDRLYSIQNVRLWSHKIKEIVWGNYKGKYQCESCINLCCICVLRDTAVRVQKKGKWKGQQNLGAQSFWACVSSRTNSIF